MRFLLNKIKNNWNILLLAQTHTIVYANDDWLIAFELWSSGALRMSVYSALNGSLVAQRFSIFIYLYFYFLIVVYVVFLF
jgi:hypothetical protein